MDFFDRKDERKNFERFVKNLDNESRLIVIKGVPGSGKTAFLKKVLSDCNINCFKSSNNSNIFKCLQSESHKSYSMFINCIYAIRKSNPKFFADFSVRFYNKLCNTTNTEAAAIVFSKLNLLGIQDVVKHSVTQIQNSLQLINEYLAEIQIKDFFAELFVEYIIKTYGNTGYIVLCIDDIQWIDEQSKNIITDIILKTNNGKIHFSLFATQRNNDSLTQSEAEKTISFYSELNEYVDYINIIEIKNFDIHTTSEYLRKNSSIVLEKHHYAIFNLTNGNPHDLFIAIMNPDKLNPEKIKNLERNIRYYNTDSLVTVEVVTDIINNDTISSNILKILAILESEVSYNNLNAISKILINRNIEYNIFSDSIEKLLSQCVIMRTENNDYKISHDVIREKVIDALDMSGEYKTYAIKVSSYYYEMCQKLHDCNQELYIVIKILSRADGWQGYSYFCEQFKLKELDINICVAASECFTSDIRNFTRENFNSDVIIKLLNRLVSYAEIKAAQSLCECLMKHEKLISDQNLIVILIRYIKVQIDTSNIDNGINSAIDLLNRLIKIDINEPNTKFEIYILAMSAYEHIMDTTKIQQYYKKALGLLSDKINVELKAIFYRNMGLVKPHQDLFKEYTTALKYSYSMEKSCYSYLIQGTCLNNLGLSYLYSGNSQKALDCFSESLKIIKSCGYDESRSHNNIGTAYCMIGDYQMAKLSFETASKLQKNDPFMIKCISSNLALALYKTNCKDQAIDLVDKIIHEFHENKDCISDTVVYCSALINKGFFFFSEGDFENAEKYYNESLFHKYRASDDKYRRKRLGMIKLSNNLETPESSIIDLTDLGSNLFYKPYSVVPFAFYVI
jgi:tetratricopeptide (TPR) repeat protein